MTPRDERREVSSGRASEATTGRLRGALRREVGDLEVRLEEAQLRSDAFRSAGLDREAAEVLEESRALVEAFHRRLESSLAEAAVEREAERIFAGADDVLDVLGETTSAGGLFSRIPAGVGAAVASLAVFAMAVVSLRAPDTRDVQTAADIAALPAPEASGDDIAAPRTFSAGVGQIAKGLSPAELEVLASSSEPETVAPLLERRRRLLDRLATGVQPISSTVLAELDSLVEQLRTEGVDVDRLLQLERLTDRARQDGEAPATDEQVDEPAPQQPDPSGEQPAEEPQQEPEQEPEPEPEPSDDDQVFPFGEPEEGESEPEPAPSDGDKGDQGGQSKDGDGDAPPEDDGILG